MATTQAAAALTGINNDKSIVCLWSFFGAFFFLLSSFGFLCLQVEQRGHKPKTQELGNAFVPGGVSSGVLLYRRELGRFQPLLLKAVISLPAKGFCFAPAALPDWPWWLSGFRQHF